MKRIAAILILSLFFLSIMHAAPVDRETAVRVAEHWMLQHSDEYASSFLADEVFAFTHEGITTHYIVNLAPDGFVIVSGDDIAVPVWMYGVRGGYDGGTLPPALAGMLDGAAEDLARAIEERAQQQAHVADMWSVLLAGTPDAMLGGGMGVMAVSPLVSTTWNQTYPYNKYCPPTSTGGSGGYVYVGCVATAMAQVMRYHNWPASGVGSNSYVHPTYGTQSANFANTTYDYANMPTSVSSSSPTAKQNAVATLSYHCGVAVEMDYGPTGSASSIYYAEQALRIFFRYKSSSSYIARSSYSNAAWLSLLTGELNSGRPVLYRGSKQNGSGGHAFIVDGYTGTDYFHMNFGWGGYLDGYFYLSSITPGSNTFTYWQKMVMGIEPDQSAPPTLVSPITQSTNLCTSPTFTWNAASGATSYRLQIATDAGFNSIVHDDATLTGTSVQVTGLNRNTQYYWRMNASGSAGTSAWTTPWTFTTMQVSISANGPTSFCDGGDVTLSTTPVTGGSCQWYRNSILIPGATQPWYTASQSGSYTVTVTLGGCGTSSDPVSVAAHPLPTATILPPQSTQICQGGSTLLVASQSPGYSYQWVLDGQSIPGATTPVLSVTASGVYTLTVSANGCSDTSDTLRVVVHPADPTDLTWTGAVDTDWNTPGNWDNPCAVPSTGDNVVIPPNCTPPASIPTCSLGDLTIDNSTGITLSGNVIISGALALLDGHLTLGGSDLTITGTGSISGGSDGSHVIADGAGQLYQLDIGTSGRYRPVTFPVGHGSGGYVPLTLKNTAATNDFGVRLLPEVRDGGLVGSTLSSGTVANTWILTSGTGSTDLALAFFWPASLEDAGFDRQNCFVSKNASGQSWKAIGNPTAAPGSDPYTLTVSGVNSLSAIGVPFSVGSASTLFPVELLSFAAAENANGILLEWRTRNETGNYGFELQHHTDASRWQAVGFVPAADDDREEHTYRFMHANRKVGVQRYRLRQIDTDGSSTLSPVVTVTRTSAPATATLDAWPNPVQRGTEAMLRLRSGRDGVMRVVLFDALGRNIRTLFEGMSTAGSEHVLTLRTHGFPAGMYFLRMDDASGSLIRRLHILP